MPSIKKELYAIQPGARILVTGANGFIGSHVVQQLLSLGYVVRGTVRSQRLWLEELFNSKYGPNRFESVVIPNISDSGALSKPLGGVSGVIHVVCTKRLHMSPHDFYPAMACMSKLTGQISNQRILGFRRFL